MNATIPFLTILLALPLAMRAAPPKPDVLVILTDQWSPRYLSWDNPQVRTPNLDRIAREGMIFDACYTPSPVCEGYKSKVQRLREAEASKKKAPGK